MKKLIIILIVFMGTMSNVLAQNTDYQFMIEYATKAPSGHNTQPWLFKIGESEIDIYPNFAKSLPAVDADNRELFVSLGCATENLCIAAKQKGYKSEIAIADDGVVRVKLSKDTNENAGSPLFSQIAVRQTNRSVYNGKMIPDDSIDVLQKMTVEPAVGIYFYKNGTTEYNAIAEMVYAGNSLQMNDKRFKAELQQWMRYNKKHQNTTQDGLSYAVFGAPNVPFFIAKLVMSKAINEKTQNKNDRKKIASSSHLVLFTTKDNTIEQWINLGRTLERVLLRATQMGIANAYLNQPNEERNISVELANALGMETEHPTILLRIGYGKKMPYSLRRDISTCILPNV
ncbi:nitroreductase [Prevotella intermedia]|jgi:hypothetical protein|uniref:Acg family FMN-binding oxidoreductase n=1 Tax=Prevotella intermedia TaxID=28131 RepID=UPI000C1BF2B0|nr:nitroreductase family protein [Prevotella intermedia]ATV27885.1 nitroreductase [Prevotella intermedia]